MNDRSDFRYKLQLLGKLTLKCFVFKPLEENLAKHTVYDVRQIQ
jgi:hypothetical protein